MFQMLSMSSLFKRARDGSMDDGDETTEDHRMVDAAAEEFTSLLYVLHVDAPIAVEYDDDDCRAMRELLWEEACC